MRSYGLQKPNLRLPLIDGQVLGPNKGLTMTKKKDSGATPRQYDEAFKREAVRLWKSSGKAAEKTARELGISVFYLYE